MAAMCAEVVAVEGPKSTWRAVRWLVVVALLGGAAVAIVKAWPMPGPPPIQSHCTASSPTGRYSLGLDQAANATTIALAAKRLGLADHAVTIGLAVALQESGLENLDHGDRDSLGLFQQRQSEGWGTPAQIMDPLDSSLSFFRHLARISGWETMEVTVAAQKVQHSAAPAAYADWEDQARVIASVLTGEAPSGFACTYASVNLPPSSAGLAPALVAQLGENPLTGPLPEKSGWMVASWVVAHAHQYGIGSVTFAGKEWTPSRADWTTDPTADMTVRFSPAKPVVEN